VFLAIFQVLRCVFLIFHDFQFPRHTLGPRVWNFHFPPFSVFLHIFQVISVCVSFYMFFSFLAIILILQCVFLFFQVLLCFSPYFISYSVCFLFSMIIIFSRHIPGSTVCISHFPPFSVFRAIFQVIQFLCLIFKNFSVFSPYSRSFHGHFSFSTFFSVSNHILCPTLCVSHFPLFSVFSPYSRSYSVHCSFSSFVSVSCHIPSPTVYVSHFPWFSVFSP
jgi:hypothetical protein